jgi:phosphate transport system substrate-binding protein
MKTFQIFKIAVKSLFFVFFLFSLFSCGKKDKKHTDNPTSGEITIMADETLKPILDAEIAVFHALYTNAIINVKYTTETDALNQLFKDSVQLIFTSRPLNSEEKDFFHSKKLLPDELKIATDGIALITHRENKDTLLSMKNFRKLLLGQITKWKQINPSSKNTNDVRIVFDHRNSSTVRFILDSVLRGKEISTKNAAVETNLQVIKYVMENRDAIGAIGVSWISDSDDSVMRSFLKKVNVIALSIDSIATYENSYQPYQGYIFNGHYPLTRNIYYINSEPRLGLATGFSHFIASERGQRIILKSGILPATQPFRIIEVKEY